MFWEHFYELFFMTFGHIQPCPNCHLWPAEDCGYSEKDYFGDFDCIAPDVDELFQCEGCHHLICGYCKEQNIKERCIL